MSSSSHSDSDSDKEPNSQGARVFWGNLKTPERSRSNFVNPPKTVVKSNKQQQSRRSTSLSPSTLGDNYVIDEVAQKAHNDDNDEARSTGCLHDNLANGIKSNAMDVDVELRDIWQPDTASGDDAFMRCEDAEFLSLPVPLTEWTSDVRSESEVEDAAVLRPSSPTPIPTDASDLQDKQPISRSQSSSPVHTPRPGATHAPRASQLPDLISFDMPTLTQIHRTDPTVEQSLPSSTSANEQPASSSAATIDDLLGESPQRIQVHSPPRPTPSPDGPQLASSNLPPMPTPMEQHVTTASFPSGHTPTSSQQLPSAPVLPAHSGKTSTHTEAPQTTGTRDDDHLTLAAASAGDTPSGKANKDGRPRTSERVGNPLPHTPNAETRKRGVARASPGKATAKVADGNDSSGEPSAGVSDESNGESTFDETADRAIKKERRVKAKQEAERKRPLLMSLSPTSADLLTLLASPGRGSPSPPRAFSDFAPEHIPVINTPVLSEAPATPRAGPSTPARRVPVTLVSPRKHDVPPLHLNRARPVNLDDPNRTPARRVPLSASAAQIQVHNLPLDDPNRTPARRVAVGTSSPVKLAQNGVAPPLRPQTTTPLPLSAAQPAPEKLDGDLSGLSSLPAASSPIKPPLPSGLRQPSSASVSKAAAKPFARPGHLLSKLPKPSSSRLPVLGPGLGPTPSVAGPSRIHAPSTAAPTRIPSPVKRRALSADIPEPAPAPPATPQTGLTLPPGTAYQRKRQRMMSEDDSDEPPAKRPMIVVRRVEKGMFNKAALNPAVPGPSTSRKDISPVRPTRPPGPLQIRPVIPGTLGHFETTRSSSRDLFKNAEGSNRVGTEPLSSPTQGPSTPPRGGSPLVDTDTASTVTTPSREPTLENIPASSPSGIGPEPSFASLAEPEPELRRTTRVRKLASASMRDPLPLTRTRTLVSRGTSSLSRATHRPVQTPGIPANQRQLQALTQANTVRNQLYIAELQRRVVRKEGPRPASPTTKVRTIMEKAKEANSKGREARAERRRRRGEGSGASTNSEGDSIDYGDASSSPPPVPDTEALHKHVRGPGDEEDYETPERPPKPSRLDPGKFSKNVKWDRSLARTLSEFAAEQEAKEAREGAEAEAIRRKGCLARDAKTLRLDPLGNVPDANIPLDSLGRERVIVTRFIYDDDDDIEATRAAKKKKT